MIVQEESIEELLNELDWDFDDSKSEIIHSIHPYPAKFISDIPRELIKSISIPEGTVILDPFCGSGVTLTEAQKAGIPSIGVDLNPIACLLSRVKTRDLPKDFGLTARNLVKKCTSSRSKIKIPAIPNLDHWFKLEIQEALARLIAEINTVTDEVKQDALRFCFSSIVVKVSNQESDTRYAAISKSHRKEDVYEFFILAADKLEKAKSNLSNVTQAKVLNKNSLKLTKTDLGGKVGLVITSPPYPNAYEYWLYHKYRMWWLGYDPIEVKDQEIGARAHYFKKNHQTEEDFVVQLNQLFSFLNKACVKEAFVCFVIGKSKIHGRIIDNEVLVSEAGEMNGFRHLTTIPRKIKLSRKSFNLFHARIKEEFIVILQKSI